MSSIVIGKSEGKNVALDIKALLRTHLLIWASTGGGKSYLIRRLVEQMFGKVPIIIVDREGEFPTLREKFGFVLVGPGGETPADPRSAKIVAERLLEMRASAVCDLFELGHEARHEWVKNFYSALVNAPKHLWGPTTVWLDEAHTFAPEKGQGESIAYGAVTDFNGVARKRGFGSIFATQRLSKLSKNATAEMYNQAAGPTARQADRDRAAYEMGISGRPEIKEFSETLRVLEPGNFYFQGRAISMDRLLVKVGEVETTHGSDSTGKYAAKTPPTPEEVKKMLPKLADLPKQAEAKAKTEAELRTQIRSLEAQLRARPEATREVKVADPKAIERAVAAVTKVYKAKCAELSGALFKIASNHERDAAAALEIARKEFPEVSWAEHTFMPKANSIIEKHKTYNSAKPHENVQTDFDGNLPPGEKAILIAAAQYDDGAERDQLSVLSGYKKSSRDAYILRLKQRGFVEERRDRIVATQTGIAALGNDYEPLPNGLDLQRYWLERLPEGEKKILRILIEANGESVERESLDDATGYKKSSRDAYLLRLGARRLVESVGRGEVMASPNLF